MDAQGGDRTVLQFGGQPVWSPDGTRIAFVRGAGLRFDDNGEIFVVNADNTGQANLTGDGPGPGPYDSGPAWSPDGTRIAFNRGGSGFFEVSIYTMGPSGEDRVRLTSGYRDFSPDWSPDGRMITFMRYGFDGDDSDVYVMNADGTGVRRLTNNGVNDENPAWSPDGTKIAFDRELFPYRVYTMNADGTGEQELATGRAADWQPIPNRLPDCSAVTADPATLVRPHADFRTVRVGGAIDPDGDVLTYSVDGVTQDEPVGRKVDARRTPNPRKLKVRAERDPRGDGRVYRIAVSVSDGKGGECTGTATVEVRRKKKHPAVDSAPPSYDSFTPSTSP
jgi:dipeptidyl aminopeptidase/acylaminoacyl peptidase